MIFVRLDAMQFTLLKPFPVLIKRHPYLIATWAFVTYVASAESFGIAIVEIGIPCLIYALIRCAFNWRKPERRSKYVFFISLIFLSSGIVSSIHVYRHHEARAYADNILEKLAAFQKTNGKFPEQLNDIPALFTEIGRPHHLRYFLPSANEPSLIYGSTFIPFDTWSYNFKDHTWEYHAD